MYMSSARKRVLENHQDDDLAEHLGTLETLRTIRWEHY